MPRGFSSIEKAAKKIEKASSGGVGNVVRFKLPGDGDEAAVRFLEEGEDIYWYWYHDFSHVDKNEGWKTKVPCLDQEDDGDPCPGCRERLPRKFQGLINLIWRGGPVFEKDSDGNYDWDNQKGTGDVLAVWQQGPTVFNKVLKRKDKKYNGLSSRDFDVIREGSGFNDTSYSVEPNDPDGGKKALSAADKKIAKDKYDLEKIARFVDADTFEQIIDKKLGESDPDSSDDDVDDDVKEFLNSDPLSED